MIKEQFYINIPLSFLLCLTKCSAKYINSIIPSSSGKRTIFQTILRGPVIAGLDFIRLWAMICSDYIEPLRANGVTAGQQVKCQTVVSSGATGEHSVFTPLIMGKKQQRNCINPIGLGTAWHHQHTG